MNKNKRLPIALIFIVLSLIVIYSANISAKFFPTQEEQLKEELEFGALTKNFLIIQEITMKKEYLAAIELVMVATGKPYINENTLMITDTNYQTLHAQRFTNESMNRPKHHIFKFPEKIHVGKGKKIILCLSTSTGDKYSSVSVPRNPAGKIGALSVKPVVNEGILSTLKDEGQVFLLEGSLCLRTYETNYGLINWFKILLFFSALLLAILFLYAKIIQPFIVQLRFVPEKIYVFLALIFGLSLVFLTPPLQTPDEQDHLNRAYQLAEFNIFQYESTVPSSLIKLFDTFGSMNFNTYKKTSIDEIFAQKKVELNPQIKTEICARPFIFPYFPQAAGMFIGKIFNRSPVELLYMGRIFNLLFAIVLIYFAIRTTPVLKWIFFLLGLMPMTLYLCASLSKDAMLIGLSFLLIAFFLRFAYGGDDKISTRNIILLFVLSFLVTVSRSVYAILIGMFFLIPLYRIGSLRKYVVVFMSLVIIVLMATQIGALKTLFEPRAADLTQSNSVRALSPNTISETALIPPEMFERPDRIKFPKGVNFNEQKLFILNNPIQYMGILFNSLFVSHRAFQLDSFVGKLGWLNKPLPAWHINFYLLILLITALLLSNKDIKIGFINKLLIASIFISGVILIETGLYLTWNPVGQRYIMDVQGRYFIPLAPLFFLLLYNSSIGKYLNSVTFRNQTMQGKKKINKIKKNAVTISQDEQSNFYNYCYLFIVCFSVLSLMTTVYVVLTGYYIVLI